jgi:Fe2+ transport system protein FeoA
LDVFFDDYVLIIKKIQDDKKIKGLLNENQFQKRLEEMGIGKTNKKIDIKQSKKN